MVAEGMEMTLTKDIFHRAHVVELEPRPKATNDYNEPKWPEYALCFDTETTLDPRNQALLFGCYTVLRLQGGVYVPVESGIFHADDLDQAQIDVINNYVRSPEHRAEVVSDEYDEHIKVYTRSEWIERVFFE